MVLTGLEVLCLLEKAKKDLMPVQQAVVLVRVEEKIRKMERS